jgi:hypothetical protein
MADKAQGASRRRRGFEQAGGLLSDRIRAVGEARGFAVARLLTHWVEIAGDDIAAVARPVSVRYGREGLGATLTLLAAGAAAPVLQMQLPRLRDRVNACYGYNAIARIRITQTAGDADAPGLAEPAVGWQPAPPPAEPPPAARAIAAPVADPGLRAALEALAGNVLSRPRSQKG